MPLADSSVTVGDKIICANSWSKAEFLAICDKMREVRGASAGTSGGTNVFRAVAQLGRAPGSGPGGRGFKSHQPDSINDRE